MSRKGRVSFNQDRCKGCGLCVSVCPVKILDFDTKAVNKRGYIPAFVKEPDKCIACVNCAIMCPDLVITVKLIDGEVDK